MAKLLVMKSGNLVQELNLTDRDVFYVGRKENCDVVLDKSPGISRQHFKLSQGEDGIWVAEVLSQISPLLFEGKESQSIVLDTDSSFNLPPYQFVFKASEGTEKILDHQPLNEEQPQDIQQPVEEPLEQENKTFVGNEEKTNIKSFTGVPYIKILGQHGKKAEYFRLEGHLWVAGSDPNAAIFLSDPMVSPAHFEISKTDKGFFITDLDSSVGSSINGQKLPPHNATILLSGDIITIGSMSLQFELRDQAFKEKVNNIPLHMYQNPLVFYEQDMGLVSSVPENTEGGEAFEIANDMGKKERKKRFLIFAACIAVLVGSLSLLEDNGDKEDIAAKAVDPFMKLSPEQKKQVVETYNLSKNLYLNANFELALVQLQKLHSIIPYYEDSQQMEEYCINSRDLKRQQELIERQEREREAIVQQVQQVLSQCASQFGLSYDLDSAKACLSPAIQLDPNNPQISQILSDITTRIEERKVREKAELELADKVKRGKELFEKAEFLHKKKDYIKAIEAYENHIHSGLPDPRSLVRKSRRHLASIEKYINARKGSLMWSAKQKMKSSQLKQAIELARKAKKVDPYDYNISYFLNHAEKELNNRMKGLYMDSVIEERFGNLEASRSKWEEILRSDVENGVYYQKSKRKLRQYGF